MPARRRRAAVRSNRRTRLIAAMQRYPMADALEARRLLSFGEPDPGFGAGGKVPVSNDSRSTRIVASFQLPDGRVQSISSLADGGSGESLFSSIVNSDGSAYTSIELSYGPGVRIRANAAAMQADGGVIIAATRELISTGEKTAFVTRVSPGGTAFDASFGVATQRIIDWAGSDAATGVAIDLAGRIVVSGTAFLGAAPDIAIARLTANGNFDPTFPGGGKVSSALGGNDFSTGVAIDLNGNYVLSGYTDRTPGQSNNFIAARYLASNGNLDPTFGSGGVAEVNVGNDDRANAVAVDPRSGRVYLAGSWDGGLSDFALVALTPTGLLDSTFGSGFYGSNSGIANLSFSPGLFGGAEFATALAIHANGSIAVAGYTDATIFGEAGIAGRYNVAVTRFTTSGAVDAGFGRNGRKVVDLTGDADAARSIQVTPDQGLLIAGAGFLQPTGTDQGIALRLRGSLDSDFSRDGVAFYQPGLDSFGANAVAIDGIGRIVTAGYWDGGASDFLISRYLPDGRPDPSFSGDGFANVSFGPGFGGAEFATGVAIQPDGKIVVVGYTNAVNGVPAAGGNDIAVARFRDNGTLDTDFDSDGRATFNLGSAGAMVNDRATGVAIDFAGRIVISATSTNGITPGQTDMAVLRLIPNGMLDPGFNGLGFVRLGAAGTASTRGNAIAMDAANRIVVVGETTGGTSPAGSSDVLVVRLTETGASDSTFNGSGAVVVPTPGEDNQASSVRVGPDRRIYVGGTAAFGSGSDDFELTILAPNGAIDMTTFYPLGGVDRATSVNVDLFGNAYLAGTSNGLTNGANNQFTAIRIKPSGAVDSSWQPNVDPAGAARFSYNLRGVDQQANAAALDKNGELIMVGQTSLGAQMVAVLAPRIGLVGAEYLFNGRNAGQKPSLRLDFEEGVSFTGTAPTFFRLQNLTTGTTISFADFVYTPIPDSFSLEMQYIGNAGPAPGVLPDGNYRITLPPGSIEDGTLTSNAVPFTFDFFVLSGDANRDRRVNFDDLLILASSYNQSGQRFSTGDFTYDAAGTVNFDDLLILASRYNQTLPAASVAPPLITAPPRLSGPDDERDPGPGDDVPSGVLHS